MPRRITVALLAMAYICMCTAVFSQTAVSTINVSNASTTTSTQNVTSPSDAGNNILDNTNYDVRYGLGNDIEVSSYVVSGTTYDRFLRPDTLVLNRRLASDRLVNIWYTLQQINTGTTPDQLDLDPTAADDADAIYLTGVLNAGYDNILVNEDDLASNSIEVETERVDVIWFQGIQTSVPGTAVFPVIERGGNDNIAVAAITSLNTDGTPASYGTLIGIGETDWPGTGQTFDDYLILRRQTAGQDPIPLLNIGPIAGQGSQTVQGVAVSFSELGVSANQSIFGYSIFAADVVSGYTSGTDLTSGAGTVAGGVDLADISTYPTNSLSSDSGLDLVAGVSAAVASDDNLIDTKGPGGYKAALATWLKANEGITTATDGSNVTLWDDQWLGNNDAQTSVAAEPNPVYRSTTSAINFNPTVDFGSVSGSALRIPDSGDFNITNGPWDRKAFNIAIRTGDDITTKQVVYEQGGDTRGFNIYINGGSLFYSGWNLGGSDGFGSPWGYNFVSTTLATDTEYIITFEYDGDDDATDDLSGEIRCYLNGQQVGTISSVGLLYNHGDDIGLGDEVINALYDNGAGGTETVQPTASFDGEISEFIYCNEPGSFVLSQRRRIESYLAIKYGITLDQTAPIDYLNSDGLVIFDATNNAAIGGYLEYNNDIAGIGRDDASELDQPASRSENTGSVVTVDKGASLSNDDTWLIWGNDGAALTETTLLTMPDTIDSRLNRVWRVAERNEAGNTSVSFDLTGLGLSSDASDFSLLIAGNSSNADFSSATVVTGGTFNGNTITFTGVDLEDGQYFTLGTDFFVCSPGGVETNLALWLRADNGTSTTVDGVDIATWSDRSGGGNDATAVGGNQPNYVATSINYNPAVNFDELNTEEMTGTAGFHSVAYYMVVNPDNNLTDASDEDVLIGFNVPAGATDEFGALALGSTTGAFTGEVVTHAIGGTGTRWRRGISSTTIPQINSGQTYLFGIRDNSGGTGTDMFVDGLEQADLVSGSFLTSVNTDYELGSYTATNAFANANHYDGQIGEVISYSVRPTDAEHNRIQSYLAVKYGITLDNSGGGTAGDYTSANSATIWDASDYATYHNDVAGIGRDDLSCLEQKQSQSVNSGSIVAMGLGSIETNNAANTNSFSADNSFLIWGDDADFADQANANTSDLPGNVTERMERIWRVDETGTIGATTIQFDLTGLGYSSTVSDFQLIVSNSPTMAGGSLTPAASLSNNILTFTNIDLTDGQYFTIGTARTSCGPGGVTTDLYVWLRADAGTSTSTDNTSLTTWSDQSGTNTSATSDGTPPLYKNNTTDNINFNPTVDFDGTDDRLSVGNLANIKSGATNGGDYTVVGVGVRQDGDWNFVIGSTGGTSNQELHFGYRNSDTQATLAHWGNDLNVTVNGFSSPSSPFILYGEYDGAGRVLEETRGGNYARSTDANSTDISGAQTNYIGDLASTGNYNGLIPEVIVFDNDITDISKQQIYTYLAIKYGITLTNNNDNDGSTNEVISGSVREGDYVASDGSTIIWTYANNTTYHNDVAGIGRDDDGCFNQKQSTAYGTDDILTVGMGTIAATNADNVNGFDDNRDYFVWGNDDGATAQASANTADVPNSIAERMTRIWKVQDTGNVGDTELQFDLTGLGYSVSDAAAFSLLVGNTATMADATIITGGTLNGNVLSFTGIDLTDGQFFTIGTANTTCGPGGVNTNISFWLRADLGTSTTTDGADLTSWTDQSSPANSGSESTLLGASPVSPTYETSEVNFNPVIRFTDPNSTNASYIETASNSVSGDMTLISVFKTGQTQGTANDFVNSPSLIGASETTGTLDYAMGMENGTIFVNANTTTTFDAETSSTFNNNTIHIALSTRVQSSGAINIYVDGNSEASGTGSTSALSDPTSFGIGNQSDGDVDAQYAGDIAETIVFSQALTSEERNRVESYLALKYGITLNSADDGGTGGVDERDYRAGDGGVIWDYDGQGTTYYNDIFGIGRDDLSCFAQNQSKSENSDALVTFNLPGGFSTDDSFLISGNDNADLEAEGNTERPGSIKSRLNREWRVQETGTVGSIELTYDISTITGPTGVGTNNLNLLRLMVDDDGDFTSGVTLIEPTSIDGGSNTVTFTVDFTDGQYYTLGSTERAALPVTLLSFTAANENNQQVRLKWSTASETNNAFFSVERSADGINFEVIGTREGAGNSEGIVDYEFLDVQPLDGQAFYRLKQTDFNGEFEYSELVRVFLNTEERNNNYKLYPNPLAKGEDLKLAYSVESRQLVMIEIISANGTALLSVEEELSPSDRNIIIPKLNVASGLHFVRIKETSGKITTLKLLVN